MSDEIDLAKIGITGAGLLGVLWGAVKLLGGRQVLQYDETMKKHTAAFVELTKGYQELRESNIRLAEKLGAQEAGLAANRERIDEAAKHWREQVEELKERVTDVERRSSARPRKGT